jgi:hypothetical protein
VADTMLTATRMLTVAVAAEMVFQLVGANMSSPQTAELNAGARAPTIGKWVTLTNIDAAAWIAFLCLLDQSFWPALGGGIAAVEMYYKYKYAINSGLKNPAPGTENYAQGGNNSNGN